MRSAERSAFEEPARASTVAKCIPYAFDNQCVGLNNFLSSFSDDLIRKECHGVVPIRRG
jgi:hypothetical protein